MYFFNFNQSRLFCSLLLVISFSKISADSFVADNFYEGLSTTSQTTAINLEKKPLLPAELNDPALYNGTEFGVPGGAEFKNMHSVLKKIDADNHDAEILISFATSNKGSAGHLALGVRPKDGGDLLVHSANFYADRAPEHANHYNEELIMTIPKTEYLYGTKSTISEKSSFGLDFGEVYKRAVIGIRIFGLNPQQKQGIIDFYQRMNRDFANKEKKAIYHYGEMVYDYMNLNCAKTVAIALRYGAGLAGLKVKGNNIFSSIPGLRTTVVHIPTETTLEIMEQLAKKGASFDVILYKKWEHSTFHDPEIKEEFQNIPNRFPSVLSLDYTREIEQYEDYDNLYAMHLFYNLGRYAIAADENGNMYIEKENQNPMSYEQSKIQAKKDARTKSRNLIRRLFHSFGLEASEPIDNSELY